MEIVDIYTIECILTSMRLLTLDNTSYELNEIPEEVDDIRF